MEPCTAAGGNPAGTTGGRDHWPQAGFALHAGGGLAMGQVIGATDQHGGRPKGRAYTPQNVLATLYHVLGIDPATTLPDHQGRPVYLLDDRGAGHGTGVEQPLNGLFIVCGRMQANNIRRGSSTAFVPSRLQISS
jgi:hypothetical protein